MKLLLVYCSTLFVLACKTSTNTLSSSQFMDTNIIAQGNLYGNGAEGITAQQLVIDNLKDWVALKTKIDAVNAISQNFNDKDLNFLDYKIIAVFDVVKTSGGHHVNLEVNQLKHQIEIKVTKVSPQGMASSVMAQPYCIIKVKNRDLPVVFVAK